MNLLILMALRNILRNARRNLFTILSIAFGLAFLFWIQCVTNGHNKNMIETVTSTFTGDIQIHQKKFLEEHLAQYHFTPSPELESHLNSLGFPWSQRIYFPSIISSGDISYPIILVGIDPDRESLITEIQKDIKSGKFLVSDSTCEQAPILTSERLSKKLEVGLDDKIVVLGQDATGSIGNQLFRLKGIFSTYSADFDKYYVFTTLACAQNIAAISGVHEILMKTGQRFGEDKATQSIVESYLDSNLSTSTWKDLVPGVADMIKYNGAMSSLINFILFSVITLGVINSMLMNIFERVREIGIMLAIGTTPTQVRLIIILESFFIALIGALIGTFLGVSVVVYHQFVGFDLAPFLGSDGRSAVGFSFKTLEYPIIEWMQYLQLVGLEIVFIVIAGIYPALRASRLKPVDTIRG